MTGYTHLVGGVAVLALPAGLLTASGMAVTPETLGMAAIGAMAGGLFPDLDAPRSLIQSFVIPLNPAPTRRRNAHYLYVAPFAVAATFLSGVLGHRTLLHSLLGFGLAALVAGVPFAVWPGPVVSLGFLLGYLSHLALDACTVSGIPLFYPAARRFHLLPQRLRLATGSPEEGIVFALLAGIALFTLVALTPLGAAWEESELGGGYPIHVWAMGAVFPGSIASG